MGDEGRRKLEAPHLEGECVAGEEAAVSSKQSPADLGRRRRRWSLNKNPSGEA